MKDSPILILDDALSAVDAKTDEAIRTRLREAAGDSTLILIAHRVATLMLSDEIIVLEDGKIIAVGSHEELLKTCPAYERMVELQRLEDESKE